MTNKDRDPFERLSQIATPEPDPQKVEAVVAMSARAFSQGQAGTVGKKSSSWFSNLFSGYRWAFPATAGAAAIVAAVVVIPMMDQPDLSSDTTLSRSPAAVAETEAPPPIQPPTSVADTDNGVRMGAAPAPQGQSMPLDLGEDAESARYDFDTVSLMVRNAPDAAALYVLAGDAERQFDQRAKEPSETLTVSDALLYDSDGTELLLVRSGLDEQSQQWDAFTQSASSYALSGEISLEIHDAQDRDAVIERLESRQAQ